MGAMVDRWPVAPELGERTDVIIAPPSGVLVSVFDTANAVVELDRMWAREGRAIRGDLVRLIAY